MSFNIVERKITGKHKIESKCEDRILENDHFICLIDGATSKSDFLFQGKKSGAKIADILEVIFHNMNPLAEVHNFIEDFSNGIRDFYLKNDLYEFMEQNPVDRLSASIIVYSNHFNQVWMVGDCQCMIGETIYKNNKYIDKILSEARALYLHKEINGGKTIRDLQSKDSGREYILPLLKFQTYFQNNLSVEDYSYGAIDGFQVSNNHIEVINVKEKVVVLASDGYPRLFSELKESEDYLNEILKKDPLCFKIYKSTKGKSLDNNSYDDRSFIKFEIDN